MIGTKKLCYACDAIATTREHIPAKVYFPLREDMPEKTDYRNNLITVPSCDVHNNMKSGDDWYVFQMVASQNDCNMIARRQMPKIIEAIRRKPKLANLFFYKGILPWEVNDKPTIAPVLDMGRFMQVMEFYARGIYFYTFKEKWKENLKITGLNILDRHDSEEAKKYNEDIEKTKKLLSNLKDIPKFGNNQKVFFYQWLFSPRSTDNNMLAMIFYEGFVVLAEPLEKDNQDSQ